MKCVIIDDEPKAIKALEWELDNISQHVEVLATFTEPDKAIRYLENNQEVQILFLDIQMVQITGFELLSNFRERNFLVIFTTAYNQYALEAIKNEAIDYLLKPIDTEDLELAIKKAEKHLQKANLQSQIKQTLEQLKPQLFHPHHNKYKALVDGDYILIDFEEIPYFESDGNYTFLHKLSKKKLLLSKNLKQVESELPQDTYFRIHKSYVVNLDKIQTIHKTENYLTLCNEVSLPISRSKKTELMKKLSLT